MDMSQTELELVIPELWPRQTNQHELLPLTLLEQWWVAPKEVKDIIMKQYFGEFCKDGFYSD
jgi:hypothetical protein